MMYRCRRLIAVVLSLAMMAFTFILNVSADDSEFSYPTLIFDSATSLIGEGLAFVYQLEPNQTITGSVRELRIRALSLSNYESLSINFDLRAYTFSSAGTPDAWAINLSSNNSYYSPTNYFFLVSNFRDYDRNPQINKMNKSPYGFKGSFLISQTGTTDIDFQFTLTNRRSYAISVYLFFENVDIHTSWNYNLSHYLVPAINGVKASLDYANGKLFSDSYSFSEITYDQNGNSTVTEKSGNWITAIWGSLKSLVAPVKNQVEQEQKAKDAGAYDALDDAYDHSSFWTFLDFTAFSDFGEYDSDSLDDINEDSWSRWFSNMTKNDLDSVPLTRGQDDDFISYYEDHMAEIENSVGKLIGGGD